MRKGVLALLVLGLLFCGTQAFAASFDAMITWPDNSTNEDGFRVERKLGPTGTFAQVGVPVGPNITIFSDTGLAVNTNYCYRAVAFNAVNTLAGPEVCGVTGAPLAGSAPGNPTIIYIYKTP